MLRKFTSAVFTVFINDAFIIHTSNNKNRLLITLCQNLAPSKLRHTKDRVVHYTLRIYSDYSLQFFAFTKLNLPKYVCWFLFFTWT